ncbi:MAG: hypothetical protein ACO1OB_30990 [Archangium sp.]
MKSFEEDDQIPLLPPAIDPWDLVTDDGAARVLMALPDFTDVKLRERLRVLATDAMMESTARKRSSALRKLSKILVRQNARHINDMLLLGLLSDGSEPPEVLSVTVH